MIPHLLRVRVTACVIDRSPTVSAHVGRKLVKDQHGRTTPTPFDWAFAQPDYQGALTHLTPIWNHDMTPTRLEESRSDCPPGVGPDQCAILLSWSVPPGWGQPLPGSDRLPELPDRWLVVRILRDGATPPKLASWVVDAGVPVVQGGAPVVRGGAAIRVGAVRPVAVAAAAPAEEPRERLTVQGAEGSKDLTFAAFAPANLGNLSHLDTLDGLSPAELRRASISYFVAGWYREPAKNDPVAAMKADKKLDDKTIRKALGLVRHKGDKTVVPTAAVGNRCLFHGMVAHIDYFDPGSYLGPIVGAPHPSAYIPRHPCVHSVPKRSIEVGFGATVEHALAALCAAQAGFTTQEDRDRAARVLHALFNDTLAGWDALGAAAQRDHAERASAFHAAGGDKEWRIAPKDADASERDAPPVTDEMRAGLAALNAAQAKADRTGWEIATLAETLYTGFWIVRHNPNGIADKLSGKLAQIRNDRLVPLQQQHTRERAAVESARANLVERLATARESERTARRGRGENPEKVVELDLSAHEVAPFHLPKEPAVALTNVGPRHPARPLDQAGRGPDQIATAPADGTPKPAPAALAGEVGEGLADGALLAALRALADEAALAEQAVAGLVATTSRFDGNSRHENWQGRNRQLRSTMAGANLKRAGAPVVRVADLCDLWEEQPWLPVFMDWKVKWQVPNVPGEWELGGRTVLAHHPLRIFNDRRAKLDKAVPPHSEVRAVLGTEVFGAMAKWDVVGQCLSGLHQQFLSRNDALPRVLPAGDGDALLAATTLAPPQPNILHPFQRLQTGTLTIEAIRVVDMFGQALVLSPAVVAGAQPGIARVAALPRRSLEPVRLSLRFAGVHGWLLLSPWDRTVVVYDGSGAVLGLLGRGDGGVKFRPALQSSPASAAAIADPVLKAFLAPLETERDFDAFVALVERALARTLPARGESAASPASLVGRPLVLVQAEIEVERRGGATLNPAYFMSDENLKAYGTPEDDTAAETVAARLGSPCLPEDGLICYRPWEGGQAKALCATDELVGGGQPSREGQPLTLSLPGEKAPVARVVTLLLDPHGKLYVDTEILPVASAALPEGLYQDALARLPAVVRLDPLLVDSHATLRAMAVTTGGARLNLPLPVGATRRRRRQTETTAEPAARFSIAGAAFPFAAVEPAPLLPSMPEAEVAAADGILIV